jgi:hypothetical protein
MTGATSAASTRSRISIFAKHAGLAGLNDEHASENAALDARDAEKGLKFVLAGFVGIFDEDDSSSA